MNNSGIIFFFFYWYGAHRDLHSFPTRRSSDLRRPTTRHATFRASYRHRLAMNQLAPATIVLTTCLATSPRECVRSEEHTSELQSQSNLVCRLLLEKKNIKYDIYNHYPYKKFIN